MPKEPCEKKKSEETKTPLNASISTQSCTASACKVYTFDHAMCGKRWKRKMTCCKATVLHIIENLAAVQRAIACC